MVTGDGNQRIGAGRVLAAGALSLGILLIICHAIVDTSRWARDLLLWCVDSLGLTEVAAVTFSVSDIILGAITAFMTWAAWHLYGHHLVEHLRPAALALLQGLQRNRRAYATIFSSTLVVLVTLGAGLLLYGATRSTDGASLAGTSAGPSVSDVGAIPQVAFDARWVVVGRSLEIGPTEFVQIKEVSSPFAQQPVAVSACAISNEFTSEELQACLDDLKRHPPRTGIGGPRRWFVHEVNGRLMFDPVIGLPPLPRPRPPMPLDLSPP